MSAGGIEQRARFAKTRPCPICGGGDDMPRGKGQRCSGFLSSDGRFAYCTREEHAGQAPQEQTDPPSWRHFLEGECRCGATHREAPPSRDEAYDYLDAAGKLLYQVVRLPGKNFRQRRPAPDGSWLWNLNQTPRVLYRLPDVLAAAAAGEQIYVVEGEKDVHAVERAGEVATCNPGGAGKWKPEYAHALEGAQVIIVADRDAPGEAHARAILATCPGARVVQAAAGKDAADHLAAGHPLSALLPALLDPQDAPEEPPSALTDLSIGERLIAAHGAELRYCYPWSQWLHWQPPAWRQDSAGVAEALAKSIVRALIPEAAGIADDKLRNRVLREITAAEKAGRIKGALELARSEPGIPIQPDDLDADLWAFNLENGTLDLRSGELAPHDPAALITRASPAHLDPAAGAPLWRAFLERCVPDPATRLFLQRACGYSMAGGNPAQILLILWGAGANGKSTFIETIRRLFGDYGQQAPPEVFLTTRDHIPNDVARLRGARFVACTEIGEGRRLNEPLIKRMTGGDTMAARFLRAEYFEFQPQFTPWLATNHRPEIRGTDEAIWRRIRLVPFEQFIPPGERDDALPEKLRAELPGILAWALEGCLAWQADGLAEPPAVLAATQAYRADEDQLAGFLEDRCRLAETTSALAGDLYAAWQDWAREQGAEGLSAKAFGMRLRERGLENIKTNKGRAWRGIKLTTDQQNIET